MDQVYQILITSSDLINMHQMILRNPSGNLRNFVSEYDLDGFFSPQGISYTVDWDCGLGKRNGVIKKKQGQYRQEVCQSLTKRL